MKYYINNDSEFDTIEECVKEMMKEITIHSNNIQETYCERCRIELRLFEDSDSNGFISCDINNRFGEKYDEEIKKFLHHVMSRYNMIKVVISVPSGRYYDLLYYAVEE